MTGKILGLFLNTLTAGDKYSLLNRGILTQHIQTRVISKSKNVFQLFCKFFKYTLNFEHFQKKVTLIAYVFSKLRTPKDVV